MARIPRTNLDVFPLTLGGNTFGWTADKEESFRILDAFVAGGGSMIDTADVYSVWAKGNEGGESESIIGEWMAERGTRGEVVVATKVGAKPDRKGLARENVMAALDESLERLRTDYIDLYYFHFDDEDTSIEDQVATSQALLESGKVRNIGLSNYSPKRMRRFFEVARDTGATLPVAVQPHYNLVHRKDYEQYIRPIVEEFDVAVFPYYGLASGFLTGKYREESDVKGDRKDGVKQYVNSDGLAVIWAMIGMANKYGGGWSTGPGMSTVALAWLRAKGATAPIASARELRQLSALMAVDTVRLTTAEVEDLDAASAAFAVFDEEPEDEPDAEPDAGETTADGTTADEKAGGTAGEKKASEKKDDAAESGGKAAGAETADAKGGADKAGAEKSGGKQGAEAESPEAAAEPDADEKDADDDPADAPEQDKQETQETADAKEPAEKTQADAEPEKKPAEKPASGAAASGETISLAASAPGAPGAPGAPSAPSAAAEPSAPSAPS
ncbi:aldo/keto reductase, partial [Corynebacterium bovis]